MIDIDFKVFLLKLEFGSSLIFNVKSWRGTMCVREELEMLIEPVDGFNWGFLLCTVLELGSLKL